MILAAVAMAFGISAMAKGAGEVGTSGESLEAVQAEGIKNCIAVAQKTYQEANEKLGSDSLVLDCRLESEVKEEPRAVYPTQVCFSAVTTKSGVRTYTSLDHYSASIYMVSEAESDHVKATENSESIDIRRIIYGKGPVFLIPGRDITTYSIQNLTSSTPKLKVTEKGPYLNSYKGIYSCRKM